MRLLRVALTDIRGIDGTVEVRFAAAGVTVIEAPNETGKTTLMDAVDVALEYKDSSKHRDVKSLWPVDRDVPSSVEVELSCGVHHLVLRRTYRKQTGTELRILAPVPATLTGDAAHDRLRELLESEVDLALLSALRFTQGRDLSPVSLGTSNVLAARLDAVAGGTDGADDGGLLDRAATEYARWFTSTGRPAKVLSDLDGAVAAAEQRHAALTSQLLALQDDAEDLARLEREIPALERRQRDELAPQLAAAEEASGRVATLEEAAAARRAEHTAAVAGARAAQDALDARLRSIAELDDLRAELGALEEAAAPVAARLTEMLATAAAADEELQAGAQAADRARRGREAAQRAVELVEARALVGRLAARQERAREVVAGAREAERALATNRIEEEALARIRATVQDLRVAQAALRTGGPTVTVHARRDLTLSLDGEEVEIGSGAAVERPVGSRFALSIPDVVDLSVVPGASTESLQRAVDDARAAVAVACGEVDAEDADHAERLAEQRREHQATLSRRDADLARELEGETLEELEGQLQTARDRVAALEPATASGTELPGAAAGQDGDVRAAATAADVAERAALDAVERLRAERDAIATSVAQLRTRTEVDAATLADRSERAGRLAERLEESRSGRSDDQLTVACVEAEAAAAAVAARVDEAARELAALQPELVLLERDNLRRQVEDLRASLSQAEQRAAGLRARLRLRGEEGLGEQVQAAADQLARLSADRRRSWARAAAAKALFEELRTARDEAYRAYRAPLRERLGRLAGLLYGRDAAVELGDDLALTHRTLDGVTLEFEQLSAGAREQLAILAGLAAAQLAGVDGVPFVLDDSLGYTDPERLARVGALLGATNDAQIIVLTCVAERFRHVGGATVVALRDLLRDDPPADRG